MQENQSSTNSNLKDLTFIALFSLIFGSMMGSGVFDIPQNVAHQSGAIAVTLSWIITGIGMLALGFAFVYITTKRPDIQSGIYGYAKHGFGDYVGFNAAWGYWFNGVLGNVSYLIYIFSTLGNFALFKFFGHGNTAIALITESVLIWVVYFLVVRGIREASIVNIMITTVKLLALFAVVMVFIYGFSFAKFKANFTLDLHLGSILDQIKSTMLVTVWDFTGIEAACIYALRAKNMKDVARATMLGVIIVLVIDALISLLPFGIVSSAQVAQLSTPSTAGVLSEVSGVFSAELIRTAVVISVSGALLAWTLLATNILYLASEDKTMPKFLTKMNHKNVPRNALLVTSVVVQIFVVAAYYTQSVYLAMIQLATSMVLVPYLLSGIFAFKLIVTDGKVDLIAFLKGLLAVLYGIWVIYAGGLKYLAFSTLLYSLGVLVYAVGRKEQKKPIFCNMYEALLFVFLVVVGVVSLYLWISGKLSLS